MVSKLQENIPIINQIYKKLTINPKLKTFIRETDDLNVKLAILKLLVYYIYKIELHDEQLLTVLAMQNRFLTEVKTGEGKSLCIAVNAVLEALKGNKTYIVTTNDYLAKRDYLEFKPLFDALDISVGHNIPFPKIEEHPVAFKIDNHNENTVIYSECTELCFDYLRDRINLTSTIKFESVIVDELDFILVDNATMNCVLSDGYTKPNTIYENLPRLFFAIIPKLSYTKVLCDENLAYDLWDVDVVVIENSKECILTQQGYDNITEILGCNILDDVINYYICKLTMQAYFCYKENIDYKINGSECYVINKNNGRTSVGCNYEIDLQNVLEVKHDLPVSGHSDRTETISYQVFYSKFKNLFGLSGTLMDVKDELYDIFKMQVIEMPTHKPCVRKDYRTYYFKSQDHKYKFLNNLLEKLPSETPKLIVTENDIEAKTVHGVINSKFTNLTINLLTNENLEDEDKILSVAGLPNIITVSTPIVGRGTDIKLNELTKQQGLAVISMCHFENMRVDNQVRGRSGRQGQHGCSYFLSSLSDNIWNSLKLEELEVLTSRTNNIFYSREYQAVLDSKRKKLQQRTYSNMLRVRRMQFISSYVVENFKDKLFNLYTSGITHKDIKSIFKHNYSILTALSDDASILKLIEDYFYEEIEINVDKFKETNYYEYCDFFKEFELSVQDYITSPNISYKNTEDYIATCHKIALDYYIFYLKKFINQYLVGDNNANVQESETVPDIREFEAG